MLMKRKYSQLIFLFFCLFLPVLILAQDSGNVPDILYPLEVPIGNVFIVNNLKHYLLIVYNFAVSSAGLLATVVIMYGGFRWAISAGNQSQITKAKDAITSGIVGLIIALCSYIILFFINNSLVRLDTLNIPVINIATEAEATLIDLPVCTDANFITECGKTICGATCTSDGGQCRGSSCATDSITGTTNNVATEECGVTGALYGKCVCGSSPFNAFGKTNAFFCQSASCNGKVNNALKVVDNYKDKENRDPQDLDQATLLVADEICGNSSPFVNGSEIFWNISASSGRPAGSTVADYWDFIKNKSPGSGGGLTMQQIQEYCESAEGYGCFFDKAPITNGICHLFINIKVTNPNTITEYKCSASMPEVGFFSGTSTGYMDTKGL